jgi:serine/threonine protein phosphatase PrpC
MWILSAGATDRGKRRANNEDSFLVRNEQRLFAVADGVGGQEGGEIASAIAVDTLREAVPDLLGAGDRTPPAELASASGREAAVLRYAVSLAHERIIEAVLERPGLSGMATTLTAVLFSKDSVHLIHIGDSRAYLLRAGGLRQLSNDHTIVAEQVKAGVLTPEQARRSIHRHVITRALGGQGEAQPDLLTETVQQDDIYLLCSDGLTEMVEDREIGKILKDADPGEAVTRLLGAANEAGGVDNITAVVVKVLEV